MDEELDDAFEDDEVMMVCPPELAAVAAPHIRAALIYRANAGTKPSYFSRRIIYRANAGIIVYFIDIPTHTTGNKL